MYANQRLALALTIALSIGNAHALCAADAFYWLPAAQVTIAGGELPDRWWPADYQSSHHYQPYAVLKGPGEAYVRADDLHNITPETVHIAVRCPADAAVAGTLYWPRRIEDGKPQDQFIRLQFQVPATSADPKYRANFLEAKLARFERLLTSDVSGSAWFRHQADLIRRELGKTRDTSATPAMRRFFGRRGNQVEDTFALVSGGRALSENLQLDRILPTTESAIGTIDIATIEGITVREYAWQIDKLQPETDPLARRIPDDQYAMLFPRFNALVDLLDQADEQGTLVLNLAQPRGESARSRERYERQLGIALDSIARLLGPQLVSSVAITGSDPYFRTGTDVAVLFESPSATALQQLLATQIILSTSAADVAAASGTVRTIEYTTVRSPSRDVCSYLAVVDDVVIVTNSLRQLEAVAAVADGEQPSLASLPEYTFFRDRYRRGDPETALLIISDKTIRRWCGPKWRIATSRRTRALAVVADLQAANMNRLVAADFAPGPIYSDRGQHLVGDLQLNRAGVHSSVHGSLEFQTPIAELDMQRVTEEEKTLYERWRAGYQSNWSNFFDPIAVRFVVDKERLAADLTVMPLIAGSQYNQFINITKGAQLAPHDGDPHPESLVHFVLAMNRESPVVQQGSNMLKMFAPQVNIDPLSWIGQAIAVFAEDSPVWQELAEAKDDQFAMNNFHRFPVALYVEVQSGLRLTAFLAGVRAFVEQTAPAMTVWETKEHQGQPYVKVSPSPRARQNEPNLPAEAGLYYAASGDYLIVTVNEDLLKRALDRYAARQQAKEKGEEPQRTGRPWLGESLCAQVDHRVLEFFELAFDSHYQQFMRNVAWNNLPILNEWKRLYPDQDPVELHARIWKTRLQSPAGDGYRWNETWQTMESISYGHPGEPKAGPSFPAALRKVAQANFGITFEEDGLRTRVELAQQKAP